MKMENKRRAFWTGGIAAAFVAAAAIFILMLQIEKNALADYEKGVIYVAAREIPEGTLLTEANISEYLERKELDISCIPDTALTDGSSLAGRIAVFSIERGVLLTEGMFGSLETVTQDMKEPVIAGFKAEDLYQVVGGVLRAGDFVHIYTVTGEGHAQLVWQDVFVEQVFDGAGNAISNEDRTTSAQRINVYLDKTDVEEFYTQLAGGSLRVVKDVS